MGEAIELILPVRQVSRDGGDYICYCPHCADIITIDGDDLSDIRGEQYQHIVKTIHGQSGCGGWLEIHGAARYVKELPAQGQAQGEQQ